MGKLSAIYPASEFSPLDRTALWIAGLITALLVILAAVIWYSQRVDVRLANYSDQFRLIRDAEARWDNGILSIQLGIIRNYDQVTLDEVSLRAGLVDLEKKIEGNRKLTPLQDAIKAYHAEVDKKAHAFERIKASYAMLRNAVAVLPNAIADCYRHPEAFRSLGDNRRISDMVTELVNAMLSFSISPTRALHAAVEERLTEVRTASQAASSELRDIVNRLVMQVEVAVKERLHGNELILQINSIATDEKASSVSTFINKLSDEEAAFAGRLRNLALGVGLLVMVTFFASAYHIYRQFFRLSRDNETLHQVNENVEEQLLQSAKLSALGQMVAGITHEINTPLAYVKAVFELIKERFLLEQLQKKEVLGEEAAERQEELHMLLDDGLHGLEEISTLVRTMKNFSRLDKGAIEEFSVEEGIESALLLARNQLKYTADVKKEFDSVPPVMASPTQLRQVLLNLIVNAADAMATMERRGVLTIRTRVTSSDMVQIDICDNGPGIPEEHMTKLFDPFFTTKPVGKGTGMGLSICYRIIENHGGTITAQSKVGKGTIFTVILPRQDEKHANSNLLEHAQAV